MYIVKRNGHKETFDVSKIENAIMKAFKSLGYAVSKDITDDIISELHIKEGDTVEDIQDSVINTLRLFDYNDVADNYFVYRYKHNVARESAKTNEQFINNYKKSSNTANATVDDNSNVNGKNIGILNAEIHKEDNIQTSRVMLTNKLKELFPDFDAKNYIKDLENHIIYKHDESSFCGPISPYCCSISLYPFLLRGIKDLGGLSVRPKNLDSYCGMFINLIFAVAGQFAGAVATSEFFILFDFFARKEWGDNYYLKPDTIITNSNDLRQMTIQKKIHQYFQQVIYSINQPASARGMQAAFVNFSYFDKPFFDAMFGDFMIPKDFDDNDEPTSYEHAKWDSVNWLQKDFIKWFNNERLREVITFPVESFALIYKDGKFVDEENAKFVAKMQSEGHSFFVYISDTADSLSSCCFSKDQKILWKSSTMGVQLTTLKELHETKWEPYKKNLCIFHNGSWVKGKSIKLPNRSMYKVTTYNNKEFYMTDNHINITLDGEKPTSSLTTNDYLMFNTQKLHAVPENDEHLSFAQGFIVGEFLGGGSFGTTMDNGIIYDTIISQNKTKKGNTIKAFKIALRQMGLDNSVRVEEPYNNVYNVRVSCKEIVAFIQKWTHWKRGTYAYNKKLNLDCLLQSVDFRRGILAGWYNTDEGNSNRCYTTSKELAEDMEALITSLGLNSIINISDRTNEKVIIRGEEFNRNYPLYCVRWYEPENHRTNKDADRSWIKKNNSIYFKIKSIEKVSYTDNVYCIECRNEKEPYFTLPSGLITHNCRLKNKVTTHEFNFTNGNLGVETGSKSVITLNLNRIIQDWYRTAPNWKDELTTDGRANISSTLLKENYPTLKVYLQNILDRVYKYQIAYNEYLWDMFNSGLLPVYSAGFISLNKQYLTIGLNGLNAAAEYLGLECNNNKDYQDFCNFIFGTIKDYNTEHKGKYFGHKVSFNTEQVPAESLAVKNYNWDKADGYWVNPNDTLYASYIYKPNDSTLSPLDKMILHGSKYIGDWLDGGSAAHINLSEHLSYEQNWNLLNFAAKNGCQYYTYNIPNCKCTDCGFITKHPIKVCPKCGSTHINWYDRVIGYLTCTKNWSDGRRKESRHYYGDNGFDRINDEVISNSNA